MVYSLYLNLMKLCGPLVCALLWLRVEKGKEDKNRLPERKGIASLPRPDGPMIWVHAASVGEAQAALFLINRVIAQNSNLHCLVTTGTITSADLMEKRLPERAFHQYYTADIPHWCERFLDYWHPDAALWMESELWPAMLDQMNKRAIPAVLVNARLSDRSYNRWAKQLHFTKRLLRPFTLILAQSDTDKQRFEMLGHHNAQTFGNIKYAADPLPVCDDALNNFKNRLQNRPCWVYASTHDGEEALACRIHTTLQATFPDLLTIIVPRHPDRRDAIVQMITDTNLPFAQRSKDQMPDENTAIYLADTLGELGLFYAISPIAMIGRSFSHDGGGGHNPIEAAHFQCAILTGPHHQYQKDLFDGFVKSDAAIIVQEEQDLMQTLTTLLETTEKRETLQKNAYDYAQRQSTALQEVVSAIKQTLDVLKS